jgi:oligopeptide/dipeptide ABC transporter ATP-binding protein
MKLLEVKDLRMFFVTRTETIKAVNSVSFDINEGETFGLLGESGSGKSMTCRSILRLIKRPGRIMGGEILYKGQDILKMNKTALRNIRGKEIGIIFQEPMTALNPVLNVKTQINESLLRSGLSREAKQKRIIELLRLVGIPSPETRMSEYTHQFSGGMRQRVMIATALGGGPKLLLADEPTTALDVTIQDQVMKLINSLKGQLGMSMILVTHDLGVVAQMCDRVAVMYAGVIMELADTVTLFAQPRHPYTHALMGSIPAHGKERGSKLEPIMGSPPNLADLPPGCPFWPRCALAEDICKREMANISPVTPGHLSRCHFPEKTLHFTGLIKMPQKEEGERV